MESLPVACQSLMSTLLGLIPSLHQQESLQALFGLFLPPVGPPLPQHCQLKSAGALSRFLKHYGWPIRNSQWWQQYQQEGKTAFHQQRRGAKMGAGRSLSPAEEAIVQRLMRQYFPDELNIDSPLWTRAAVQSLIACECGIQMPIRTVGEYLKRWGIRRKNRLSVPTSKTL